MSYFKAKILCTKVDFDWGSAALCRPPSWNKGDLLLREGERCREGKGRRGKGSHGREEAL